MFSWGGGIEKESQVGGEMSVVKVSWLVPAPWDEGRSQGSQEGEVGPGACRTCLQLHGLGKNAVSVQRDSNNSRLRVLPKFGQNTHLL